MSILKANRIENLTTTDGGISLDNSGRIGIGTSAQSDANSNADDLVIKATGSGAGITIFSDTNNFGNIYFGDSSSAAHRGRVRYDHTNDALTLSTSANERCRILSSGGLTFNGDTAQANALDDYEEGAWTAGLSCAGSNSGSVTFTSNTGSYIKIGKLCFISIFLQWSASTLSGSGLQLTGLPFTQQTNAGRRGGFLITYRVNALTGLSNVHDLTLRSELNNTLARFQYGSGDGNAGAEPSGGDIKNAGASMMITGTYETI